MIFFVIPISNELPFLPARLRYRVITRLSVTLQLRVMQTTKFTTHMAVNSKQFKNNFLYFLAFIFRANWARSSCAITSFNLLKPTGHVMHQQV